MKLKGDGEQQGDEVQGQKQSKIGQLTVRYRKPMRDRTGQHETGLRGEERREEGTGLFIIWRFDRKRREEDEEGRGTEGQPRSCPSGGPLSFTS